MDVSDILQTVREVVNEDALIEEALETGSAVFEKKFVVRLRVEASFEEVK